MVEMTSDLVYSRRFQDHQTGRGHPERPERLAAVVEGLTDRSLWSHLTQVDFEAAERSWLETLHRPSYVDRCFAACERGESFIDSPDSAICPASATIAQLAVGGVLTAAGRIAEGQAQNAFCAVRPPGHHAEADRSMGFCLFNHIALAAEALSRRHGFRRIAIVDFDVHHGNGTQHLFERRNDVFFISLHQDPNTLFPGTGFGSERGKGDGTGYTLNLPLPPNSDDERYITCMQDSVEPALDRFKPDILLVSAGFDAAAADPLAQMRVTSDGFDWIARFLTRKANELCHGRLLASLEGGYDLVALSDGVSRFVQALLDAEEPS
jgi:acetoin utilization deacetylase AcuC-like enzyme